MIILKKCQLCIISVAAYKSNQKELRLVAVRVWTGVAKELETVSSPLLLKIHYSFHSCLDCKFSQSSLSHLTFIYGVFNLNTVPFTFYRRRNCLTSTSSLSYLNLSILLLLLLPRFCLLFGFLNACE